MLVLSRKIGEKIHLGNEITVEVRRVAGNRVTLAIDAPRTVRILRGELREAATAFDSEGAVHVAHETVSEPSPLEPYIVVHHAMTDLPAMPHVVG